MFPLNQNALSKLPVDSIVRPRQVHWRTNHRERRGPQQCEPFLISSSPVR